MALTHPPCYDAASSSAEMPGETLPPYELVAPRERKPIPPPQREECPTLILDKCTIYSRLQNNWKLYEVDHAPCEASSVYYSVKKISHKVAEVNGDVKTRTRDHHIYDIKSDYMSLGLRDISIVGKGGSKRSFPEVQMSMGTGPSSFKVDGHFKTDRSLKNRLQKGSEILWKNTNGTVIAVETKVERNARGNVRELPRLEIKVALDEKTMDLLVTCWCGRLWKQAEKEVPIP